MTTQEFDQQDISFSDMLDEFTYIVPERGQILSAIVLEADENEILLDVGLKRDAIVTRRDLSYLDPAFITTLVPGKATYAYVMQAYNGEGDLIVSINKALELEDWQRAEALMEENDTIDVTVVGTNRGGALVQFGRIQGFIPNSHLYSSQSDVDGMTLRVKVIEIERRRNRLVFSEREAKFAEKTERMSQLQIGDIVNGTVVHLTDFGAFVDIGGADGLVHVSNIVHQHIDHPSDILEIGQEIEVRIDEIDLERQRISLNRKALLPDPWETFLARNQIGDLVQGRVTNVVDYGIFVAAPGGMEGLVHVSKMQSLNLSHPTDMFKSGDEVLVRVLDIDANRQRVQMDIDSISSDEQVAWLQSTQAQEDNEEDTSEEDHQEDTPQEVSEA